MKTSKTKPKHNTTPHNTENWKDEQHGHHRKPVVIPCDREG